jgi:hypothetical protein
MTDHYRLTISRHQAQVINEALDLYARLHMGQVDELAYLYRALANQRGLSAEATEAIDGHCAAVSRLVGPASGGYYGIAHQLVSDTARVAHDIKQVVRHRLAWDRTPDGGMQVDFDQPHAYGSEPLPTIDRMIDGEPERYPAGPVGTVRLTEDLEAVLDTKDLGTALARIKAWKGAALMLAGQVKP